MKAETTTEKEIMKVIELHKDFFNETTADIAFATKGEYLFYYTEPCGEKTSFNVFHTAGELRAIILYELIHDLKMAADISIENINEILNRTRQVEVAPSYADLGNGVLLSHMAESIDKIYEEMSRWLPTMARSFKELSIYCNETSHT